MRTPIAIAVLVLAFGQECRAQYLTLNAGDTFTYSFTTMAYCCGYIEPPLIGGQAAFEPDWDSLQASDLFTIEMFEDSAATSLIFSRTATGENADGFTFRGGVPGAWQDLEGAVRFSVTAGSVTLFYAQFDSFLPGPPTENYDYFHAVQIVVPEPEFPALAGAAGAVFWAWRWMRKVKNCAA